jgi:hypothetical protein
MAAPPWQDVLALEVGGQSAALVWRQQVTVGWRNSGGIRAVFSVSPIVFEATASGGTAGRLLLGGFAVVSCFYLKRFAILLPLQVDADANIQVLVRGAVFAQSCRSPPRTEPK